jgi:tryptophan 2,3-dioxygenase
VSPDPQAAPAATSLPATSLPATSLPATSLPATSLPATSLPATSVPATAVPATAAAEDGPRYDGYLRLPVLLDQQRPVGPDTAHDELLFIVAHQVYELWFKVLLHELADARDRMLAGDVSVPVRRLRRCRRIVALLTEQLGVLDTMTPPDFALFRPALGTASGAQSRQFWQIEALSGGRERSWIRRPHPTGRLRTRRREPTLWDGYLALLDRAGLDVSTPERRRAAYARAVRAGGDPSADPELARLGELTEALIDHDQAWALWRTRHALSAERQIGAAAGTGGSSGSAYLRAQANSRFYPELWAAGRRRRADRRTLGPRSRRSCGSIWGVILPAARDPRFVTIRRGGKAVRAAAPAGQAEAAGRLECEWQHDRLPEPIRALVLDDQRLRNDLCRSVFH